MKKTFNKLGLMVMALFTIMTMTSCDDDTETAWDLDGIWSGTITGNYYKDRYGNITQDVWETEIQFVQDGDFSRGGWGRERDWQGRRLVSDVNFDWKVRNGRIYMYFDDGYDVVIRDYDLYYTGSTQRFRGYFESPDGRTDLGAFSLSKVANWTDFSKAHTNNGLFSGSTEANTDKNQGQ